MPTGNLPPKAARMWEHVYASAIDRGYAKDRAARQAWGAVERHYRKVGGRWMKRKSKARKNPGAKFVAIGGHVFKV